MSPQQAKRRRRDDGGEDCATAPRKHLYLVLDDWKGGYSIHKLDADDMEPSGRLPEPAALRLAAPQPGKMTFAGLGANIFVDTSWRRRGSSGLPTLVYSAGTGGLTLGPLVPDGLRNLGVGMAVGERLYVVAPSSLLVMSPVPPSEVEPFDPAMRWSWNSQQLPAWRPPPFDASETVAYAVHPDGRTVFMSMEGATQSLDTEQGVWRDLGDWALPFRGQAYYDADLDTWVGLHREEHGRVCCCPVASRSAAATPPQRLECRMLRENLLCCKQWVKPDHWLLKPSLTYLGDSRFCLVVRGEEFEGQDDDSVLHVIVFGLKYDHRGELKTKVRRTTRSYQLSKNSDLFSHAAFWM